MTIPPPIPVVLGTTASGKTSIGISLAKNIGGEVISVDSRKVYRYLPVGTATPEGIWKEGTYIVDGIPHHLMAHLNPDQPTTAGDFAKDAEKLILEILGRKKTPILVGGTGFYFKALEKGLPQLPARDEDFRANMAQMVEQNGVEALHVKLGKIDPVSAAAISSQDRHKIIRALEVHQLTGQPFSQFKPQKPSPFKFTFKVMGLQYPSELLNRRIEKRSERMVKDGMIEEAKKLLDEGYSNNCPALASFGYKEAVQVVEGSLPREEFLPKLIKGTTEYAKRQRTWFRTQVNPHWFSCDENTQIEAMTTKMIDFLNNT